MANDPADTCAPGGPRPPGRPRDPAVHVAILDAAEALLAEAGYARMSVEAVAARAGTSKATIYRWWPSKEALVVEALERRRVAIDVPRTDDPRADLVALLRAMVATLPPRSHSPIARLVGATADSDELAALLRTRIVGPRRARVGELVTAAVDAGALDPAVDVELAVDLLVGPVLYRHLVSGGPIDAALPERLVAVLFAAHRPTPQETP